ncbi:MAG: TonB-dependent receptor, partial [Hymenobacteraceae bacterium]|nr:TonB-dependent receptor [Hymenobacteraceae bacterium]
RNLRQVRSRGVEGQVGLALRGAGGASRPATTLHLAGQLLHTRKTAGAPADPDPVGIQLPYVPARTGSVTLAHEQPVRRATLGLDLTGTATSLRTTNASGTETLPAYSLLNAGLWGEWPVGQPRLRLRLDSFNLLGTEYQSLPNRPMPGRAWLLTLSVLGAK